MPALSIPRSQPFCMLCANVQVTSVQSDDYSDVPNSQIRRITAKRLLESKQTVPHYYLTIDCRVDKLVQLRQQLNANLAKDGKKLSVNDFVIKASAAVRALAFTVGWGGCTCLGILTVVSPLFMMIYVKECRIEVCMLPGNHKGQKILHCKPTRVLQGPEMCIGDH